jgi:hypothetical protein
MRRQARQFDCDRRGHVRIRIRLPFRFGQENRPHTASLDQAYAGRLDTRDVRRGAVFGRGLEMEHTVGVELQQGQLDHQTRGLKRANGRTPQPWNLVGQWLLQICHRLRTRMSRACPAHSRERNAIKM